MRSWHVPVLFAAALATAALHVPQHTCFFSSALVFWWAVFGRGFRALDTTSIGSLFTTTLHTSALALLLTFAPTPWHARSASGLFGLTAFEDQRLGGLVMRHLAAWRTSSRVL